jgi:hypothetical protein
MGTYPPDEEEMISYYTPHILGLWNIHRLPVIFFGACLTARLDYDLGDLLQIPFLPVLVPCFAWCFVGKPRGGAVATVGATRVAYSMVDEDGVHGGCSYLSVHFFKGYHQDVRLGEMLVSSQNDYLNNVWKDPLTVEEFILLGDPSLKVGGVSRMEEL